MTPSVSPWNKLSPMSPNFARRPRTPPTAPSCTPANNSPSPPAALCSAPPSPPPWTLASVWPSKKGGGAPLPAGASRTLQRLSPTHGPDRRRPYHPEAYLFHLSHLRTRRLWGRPGIGDRRLCHSRRLSHGLFSRREAVLRGRPDRLGGSCGLEIGRQHHPPTLPRHRRPGE